MATAQVVRTDLSGTSFVLDVTALELNVSLSTIDYEVTHNGAVVTPSYAKTSVSQLTYTGTSVTLGTRIIARRVTSITQAETTFISTTTASALTNALEKERLRLDELDNRISYVLNQLVAGGITLGTIPISSTAFGAAWNGDNTNAPSRAAVFNKETAQDTTIAGKADTTTTNAALALKADLASPTFTGDPKAPTPTTSDNDTSIATTAFVKAQHPAVTASGGESTFILPNGLKIKFGSVVVTFSANFSTYNWASTPAFATLIAVLVTNGDTSVTNSVMGVNSSNTIGMVLNAPSYAAGNARVNFIAIGT